MNFDGLDRLISITDALGLRAVRFVVFGNKLDKSLNTVIGHEHIFFPDGTDIGYGGDGIYSGEEKTEYSRCEDIDAEKEEVMEAIDQLRGEFDPDDYKITPRLFGGNNCQDFADAIRENLQ